MGLKDYLERAQHGDDADLNDFTRRVLQGGPTEEGLATAYDRWLYTNVVAPAAVRSHQRMEIGRLIEGAAKDMLPIMKGTGALAMARTIMRAARLKEQ